MINIIPKVSQDDRIKIIQSNRGYRCTSSFDLLINSIVKKYGNNSLEFIKAKLWDYKVNTDKLSKDHMDYAFTCLHNAYNKNKYCCPSDFYFFNTIKKQVQLDNAKNGYNSRFKVKTMFQEVFYGHHGLRFSSNQIKNYVKNKDFIDIGAFVGDSATVLSLYTNKNIYSFELNPKHINLINQTLIDNNISDKVIIVNLGIGDKEDTYYINAPDENGGTNLNAAGETLVNVTTLDTFISKHPNIDVGLIKADVEGSELNILKGAINTIKKFRPIITFSLYHNAQGIFGVPDFLRSMGNYILKFRSYSSVWGNFGELIVFAYPAEIGDFNDII